jgi:hypothetical protein
MKKSLLAFLIAAAPFCVFAQLPSYLPTDGLVGWWPFNGNANDESGNGNDGIVTGAELTNDRNGEPYSAYDFNYNNVNFGQQNQEIYIPYNPILNTNNITISLWINARSYYWNGNPNLTVLVNRYQYGYSSPNGQSWGIGFRDYEILGSLNGPLGTGDYTVNYNSPIILNTWNNLIMTFDGFEIKLFLNSSLVATTTHILPMNTSGNSGISIGESNQANGFWHHTDGIIDDLAIYNRALTPEEITALYTGVPTDNNGGGSSATTTVPAGISYQAVARNAQGQPLSDTDVQVKFTLLTDSLTGAAEYSESHSLTTNSLGLFTTAFGAGTAETGTFAGINWASGSKYLKVELDAGSGFVEMGTQQLLSVPYSMRSNTSAKAGTIENAGLPVYADNPAALAGGLLAGQMYRTVGGVLMVVY